MICGLHFIFTPARVSRGMEIALCERQKRGRQSFQKKQKPKYIWIFGVWSLFFFLIRVGMLLLQSQVYGPEDAALYRRLAVWASVPSRLTPPPPALRVHVNKRTPAQEP